MLAYAFQVLKQSNYDELSSESFENIHDLFAAILLIGISQQVKQGLHREFVPRCDDLPLLQGKLNIIGSIGNRLQGKRLLNCEFDEFSEDNIFNRIFKTTMLILLKQPTVEPERKLAIKNILFSFSNIKTIDKAKINWNMLRFTRNNQNYKMLLTICYFVLDGLLISTEKGHYRLATFLDEQKMSRLFEKFVLEFFKYHYPHLGASSTQIDWNIDDDNINYLPIMKTDTTLSDGHHSLIIDTKYYSRSMQTQIQYDSYTIHSQNLYQIFTYVKNCDVEARGNVSGLILYAKTNEAITPDCDFFISGNKISAKTLDLNQDFNLISNQLDSIVLNYFG